MASDYLLELDGVKGESKDEKHAETIEISSFSWGASNPTSVGSSGLSAGKVTFSDFQFSADLDKAGPVLLDRCATGVHIKKATIWGRKSGADARLDYYKVVLEDCVVSSYSQGGGGSGIPSTSFSLSFSKVQWEYCAQKDDQSLDAATIFKYDLKLAKK